MSTWNPCIKCGVAREDSCACNNPQCPDYVAFATSGVESEVCSDIADRQQRGIAKYGVTVADNPLALKAWLQHAYEEVLDQAIYLKRAIREIERREGK